LKYIIPDKKFGLIQEDYLDDPWKILMSCIMLNQTSHKQVKPLIKNFFHLYPTPDSILEADHDVLVNFIRPLGLYNRRARTMKKFSNAYKHFDKRDDPKKLPGIGQYGADAYNILVNHNYSIVPNDGPLNSYMEWYKKSYLK
jgi:methyl-CpG-binding domain protein 4